MIGRGMSKVPFSIGVGFEEYSSRGILGGIGGNGERFVEVGERENQLFGEFIFQLVKCFLTRRAPSPLLVFLGEVNEGVSYVGVTSDELLVEVGKSKK